MAKFFAILALVASASLFSAATIAQLDPKAGSPPVAAADHSVDSVFDAAFQNKPSAATTGRPTTTLDDYTQERRKIMLLTIVPYILLATPVILLIVLVSIRFSGMKSPEHMMMAAALVLVIQATLTVSMTSEGSDSLSASMGILGAIAGYLFGRSRQDASLPLAASAKEPVHAVGNRLDAVERADERSAT
jgi:hypothetical protein